VYSWAELHNEQLPGLAAGLVRRPVDVIVTTGIPATKAAQTATKDIPIPIVFGMGGDPVEFGLVASLNRPGGNITGMSSVSVELTAKRLELLHEMVPAAAILGLLVNPTNPNVDTLVRDARRAAAALGVRIEIGRASGERDFDGAFTSLAEQRVGALAIANTGLFNDRADQLGALALRHAMPTIFQSHRFAAAGGLMSYGDNSAERDMYHEVGVYVGRILKGAKPADLPVQLSSRPGLIINNKTAKLLGLTVPLPLAGLADEVID
jgi:putative ABC transport system substrate-binding protein